MGTNVKRVVIYRGMPVDELQQTLKTSFDLGGDVSGVQDRLGTVFPLSLMTKTPSFFKDGPYVLVEGRGPSVATSSRPSSAPAGRRLRRSGTVSSVFNLADADFGEIVATFK